MSLAAPVWGNHLAYPGAHRVDARQRILAIGAVVALHVAVIGGFMVAKLRSPPTPPETILTVSLIAETAAPSPAPPQPAQAAPPPPEPRLMATPQPTLSTMTAPPMEKEPPREVVELAPPPAPVAPAPAPPAPAPVAAIIPPNFTAAYLNNPGPAYPAGARRRREEGTVRLRVQVSAEGAPAQVSIDRSSGSADLDAAALDVVKKRWRFSPAKQGDRAVAAWVIVPMEFSLKTR